MIKKLSLQMAVPQIFSAMTATLCMLIDGMVIGRLIGVEAMSAYGFATPLLVLFTSIGTMMANGVQVVCAKALGRGDLEEAGICYSTSVVLSLILGAFEFLVIAVCCAPVCVLLGAGDPQTGETISVLTSEYLRGYVFGAPLFFLNQIAAPYMQSMGKRKILIWSVAAMIVSDVVFDLVSVYVFHAAMFGIGVASALSYLSALLVCTVFFLQKECPFRFSFRRFRVKTGWELFRAGGPVILSQLFYVLRVRSYNQILVGIAGTAAVAAFSAISTLSNILFSIGLGSGSVMLLLSSLFYNEKDRASLEELIRSMVKNTLFMNGTVLIVFECISPGIVSLFFESGTEAYAIGLPGFCIFALSLMVSCINTLYKNYYQGIGHTRFTNLIAFLESIVFTVSFSRLLGYRFGLTGVWVGCILGQMATFAVVSLIVWKKYGRVSLSAAAYCYLDADFEKDVEGLVRFAVTDTETALEASRKAAAFFRENGLDSRKTLQISLCVEEICMNVIQYGFRQDNREHHLDVCVILQGETLTMRFRDDCISFDPTKYWELHERNDPVSHIGIHMIMGMVKDASYINTFGLNNLTLVL